jgi:hypothetical protein
MSAIGYWKVTLTTPMGPQIMQLRIISVADRFSGRIESAMGNHDIEGTVSGDSFSWIMHATKPIAIKVTFAVVIDGDTLRGTAKAGPFPKAAVIGERIAPPLDSSVSQVAAPGAADAAGGAGAVAGAASHAVPHVTADSIDPDYHKPFIEVNELRQQPVPHRYVHGGFAGTDARFSFYFPPKEQYQGRFFHNTYPLATTSDIGPFPIQFEVAVGDLGFTLASGAYYVQTNLGGSDRTPPADAAIGAYRVNAAAAKYSRELARGLYDEHRPYGYLFGGSGGSYQVQGAAENTDGVWDGFLPFVLGSPHAIPSMFTIRMHAMRVLRQRDRFPSIMDAIDPGGSGEPCTELNDEERAALTEATLMGYPPRGWWNHETLTSGYFSNVAPIMPLLDPDYVEDFWREPGYLGTAPGGLIRELRFHFDTIVKRVIDGYPKQMELAAVPDHDFTDAHLVIVSGASAGKSIPIGSIDGHLIGFAFAADQAAINAIAAGDQVRIDNAWALALQTYHRHQVPESTEFYAWNQFRNDDGQPKYPQRELLIGPIGAANTAGAMPIGAIRGKVLALSVLMDIDALPWQADWYRSAVKRALGNSFENNFVLWFIDHAQHENPLTVPARARTVSYCGALQQGLRDLAAWVEQGVRPPDTNYRVVDTQVQVPADATERGGIQPVVHLLANGAARADIRPGDAVAFSAVVDVPPGAGQVVLLEWDFNGEGRFPIDDPIRPPKARVSASATHRFDQPGTYFPVVRVTSQRQGDAETPYGRVQNLARVRVVVGER